MIYDMIIIGSGAAGMNAALYAGRSGLNTLVLESVGSGGQMNNTYEVANYLGFPENPSGAELAQKMRAHAGIYGAEFRTERVKNIENVNEKIKTVNTRKNSYQTRCVLFATGANPRKLNAPGEAEFSGIGVSYCATCDGAFFRGQTTAVVGGGNTAFEDALCLARFCSEVYLIHRSDRFRASAVLVEEVKNNPKIHILPFCTVSQILGDTTVKQLSLQDSRTGETKLLDCSGVFIAIGRIAANEIVPPEILLDESGFIRTDERMQTNIPGIYAAGDIRTTPLRQVITAAADGAVAAISALNYLDTLK
ncbi:MAG: thioredoxin-disulfide reductase [Ruminococcaceae bacterium]|nr:thioredoxin-disulfide reductase [Oscillospiraceae bacterium]